MEKLKLDTFGIKRQKKENVRPTDSCLQIKKVVIALSKSCIDSRN